MFHALNISKEWNIPQTHRIDVCFNCGDPDPGIPKCPTIHCSIKKNWQQQIQVLEECWRCLCGLVAKMPIAMLVQDMAVVMEIIPTLTGSGKEAMQNLQPRYPLQDGIGKHKGKWSMIWYENLAGGMPPITWFPWPESILFFPFLPPISSGLCPGRLTCLWFLYTSMSYQVW